MASLHEGGWRQGSLLSAPLQVVSYHTNSELPSRPLPREFRHDVWCVVTQNCDLDALEEAIDEAAVELRPVFESNEGIVSGIRSRKVRLRNGSQQYLDAQSNRVMISPALPTTLHIANPDVPSNPLTDHELLRLQTWLGRRYDRPAVPPQFGTLAKHIAAAVKMHKKDPVVRHTRDVLCQFEAGDCT